MANTSGDLLKAVGFKVDKDNVITIGHYALGDTVGSGTFGKVKFGVHLVTGNRVAVKIINRAKLSDTDATQKIKREIQNLRLFRHPHIIKLYQVISTSSDIFMVMEYVSGGELFTYISKHGKLQICVARRFFQQIISGLDYCHRRRVVHRDLKPENLLLDHKLNVKIADFGLSNMMFDGDFLSTSCGSPNYAAPEIISAHMYAGPEVDIWSCGVILYAMLCGFLPFDDDSVAQLFLKIKRGVFIVPDFLDDSVVTLIQHMLQTRAMKRATIEEIRNHDWFKVDLPAYLFPNSGESNVASSVVSQHVVQQVCEMFQTTESEVHAALVSADMSDQLSVAYCLLRDNLSPLQEEGRVRRDFYQSETPAASHQEATTAATACAASPATPSTQTPSKSGGAGLVRQHPERVLNVIRSSRQKYSSRSASKLRWHLGIRSESRPQDIMREVFHSMKQLDYRWRILSPYTVRVRHKRTCTSRAVKMMLQLFQVDYMNCLLDFKYIRDTCDIAKTDPNPADMMLSSPKGITTTSPQTVVCSQNSGDIGHHATMEFFEMCSNLIMVLAR